MSTTNETLNEYRKNEQYPWIIIITGWGGFVSSKIQENLEFMKIFHSPHAHRNAIEYRYSSQVVLARKIPKTCAKSTVFDSLLSLVNSPAKILNLTFLKLLRSVPDAPL